MFKVQYKTCIMIVMWHVDNIRNKMNKNVDPYDFEAHRSVMLIVVYFISTF